MATQNISNAPANLDLITYRSTIDAMGGYAKSCRFMVRILPTGQKLLNSTSFSSLQSLTRDMMYLCETAEMPGRSFMNIDLRHYGPNHKLPFQTTYEDMNLTFVCRNKSYERQFFDDWANIINPPNSWDFSYRDDYASRIEIFQFSDIGVVDSFVEYKTILYNAYPLLISPQPMSWYDDQFQRLVVTVTYTHWVRDWIDPQPVSNASIQGFSFNLVNTPGKENDRGDDIAPAP